jgi:hypothetical protein
MPQRVVSLLRRTLADRHWWIELANPVHSRNVLKPKKGNFKSS